MGTGNDGFPKTSVIKCKITDEADSTEIPVQVTVHWYQPRWFVTTAAPVNTVTGNQDPDKASGPIDPSSVSPDDPDFLEMQTIDLYLQLQKEFFEQAKFYIGHALESKNPVTGKQDAKRVSRTFRKLAPAMLHAGQRRTHRHHPRPSVRHVGSRQLRIGGQSAAQVAVAGVRRAHGYHSATKESRLLAPMKFKMFDQRLFAVAPLLLLGGCNARAVRPISVSRAQFVQAAIDQDSQTMQLALGQPTANSVVQLGTSYSTPENQKDPTLRGETLPMWALRTGRLKTAQLLLFRAPASKNAFGRTPQMYAALYAPEVGPDQDLFNGMLQFPSRQLSAVDNNGDSALFLAVRRGSVPFTESLLRAGEPFATPRGLIRNKRGQTIVDVAKATHNQVLSKLITKATTKALPHRISPH